MKWFHIRRPSAGMTVAFIALLAALSGTAVALPGSNSVFSDDIRTNAVQAADIRQNAVGPSEIRNNAVRSREVRDGSLRAEDFDPSALPQGSKAYAKIIQSGGPATVDAGRSNGITTANVLDFGTGAVCISGLPFTPKNVMGTLDNFDLGFITTGVPPSTGACPAGTQIRVQTWNPGAVPAIAELDFAILVN
jgi:hypothetical protein